MSGFWKFLAFWYSFCCFPKDCCWSFSHVWTFNIQLFAWNCCLHVSHTHTAQVTSNHGRGHSMTFDATWQKHVDINSDMIHANWGRISTLRIFNGLSFLFSAALVSVLVQNFALADPAAYGLKVPSCAEWHGSVVAVRFRMQAVVTGMFTIVYLYISEALPVPGLVWGQPSQRVAIHSRWLRSRFERWAWAFAWE